MCGIDGQGGLIPHAGQVRSVQLFDIYKPVIVATDMTSDERSLSVRLELLDDEVGLTEERIEKTVAQVLSALSTRLAVRLRG